MKKDTANYKTEYSLSPRRFAHDYILCGFLGLFTEICFTSMNSLKKRDLSLKGTTSLRMFPIYGMAAFFTPVFTFLQQKKTPVWLRGSLYTLCIFTAEFCSGQKLRQKKHCPWDYHHSRYHVKGLIRLDYAPWWFLFSLALEKALTFLRMPTGRPEKKTAA